MIKPHRQDDDFLADVHAAPDTESQLHLWWLGQSGFLVAWNGHHLLLDPYLSDSLTKKYAQTDKPHVRMTERVIAPERLGFVEVVTSSHNHTDHLDAETLLPLFGTNPAITMVLPEANRDFISERLGKLPPTSVGLTAGSSAQVGPFRFHAIPAAHNELETDALGRHRYLGYVVQVGSWTLYHSGDTLRYAGMEAALQPFEIDLALLPINGNIPERRVAGNLGPREAAQLATDTRMRLVIPCHYDMFTFNTASPDDFSAEARRLNQAFKVLTGGERLTLHRSSGN